MKCPVCDHEFLLESCPLCGYEPARDYGHYPTFAPVSKVPTIGARRREWQNCHKEAMRKSDGPHFVDYQKMVSEAAQEMEQKRHSREAQLLQELQAANVQISELMQYKRTAQKRIDNLQKELKALTDYLLPENRELKERILSLDQNNKALIQESVQMEDNVHELSMKLAEEAEARSNADHQLKRLANLLTEFSRERDTALAENDRLQQENGELRASLEAEQSKGLFARIFK